MDRDEPCDDSSQSSALEYLCGRGERCHRSLSTVLVVLVVEQGWSLLERRVCDTFAWPYLKHRHDQCSRLFYSQITT